MKYKIIKRSDSFRITDKENTIYCKSESFANKVCFLLNQNEAKIDQAKIESRIKEKLRTGLKIDLEDVAKWNNNQRELTNDFEKLGVGFKLKHDNRPFKTFDNPEDTSC